MLKSVQSSHASELQRRMSQNSCSIAAVQSARNAIFKNADANGQSIEAFKLVARAERLLIQDGLELANALIDKCPSPVQKPTSPFERASRNSLTPSGAEKIIPPPIGQTLSGGDQELGLIAFPLDGYPFFRPSSGTD